MIVVASTNGSAGIRAAMDVLRGGGSALDAVEVGVRLVEDNLDNHTVGSGGVPHLLGELELDAAIMDGRTLEAGAVSGLKGYANPIAVARRVMTDLPHVLLTGEGAARFAAECGFPKVATLTDASLRIWRERLAGVIEPDSTPGDERFYARRRALLPAVLDPPLTTGTVNFIARDRAGDLATATSTAGWALKYPGRAADSAVIGAGNYCDNRFGAACCTGRGELAIRAATARSVVLALKHGRSVEDALTEAMEEIAGLEDRYFSVLNILALDADGTAAAVTNGDATYLCMTEEMADYVERPRRRVTAGREPGGRGNM
jgi:beta-aspartyl-peptidase (threonine type)